MTSPKLRFKEFRGEWKLYKLKDKACFLAGYAFDSNKMDSKEGKYQLLKMSNVYQNQLDLTRNSSYWHDIDKSYERWLLERGDIVLTLTGTVGKKDYGYSIEVPESNKFLLNQRLVRLRQIDGESLSKFLKYRISTDRFFYHFFNISKGGTGNQSNVSIEDLKLIEVNFPSIDEQIKIANFLSSVDEKISQLNEQHQLMLQYKKGVMQKIFSQEIRFKDDNGEEFGEWQNIQIKDIFSVTRGQVLSVSQTLEYKDDIYQYPVYSSQTKNKGLLGYYSDYLYQDAITWTTDGANAGEVNFRKGKFYCTNVCGVLLSNKGYANSCVSEILNSIAKRYVSYVGNPKLMNNVMSEILINIPSDLREQTKISDFLTAIDKRIENLARQLEQAKIWKKGLLQQMFV